MDVDICKQICVGGLDACKHGHTDACTKVSMYACTYAQRHIPESELWLHLIDDCVSPRVIEKPWKADDYNTEVVDNFVRGKDSMGQLIQHSDVFSEEYNKQVQDMEKNPMRHGGRWARNLRSCKHRLDSVWTPLGRASIFLHAFLMTCVVVAVRRKGKKEGKSATAFLEWVTTEHCVSLAMNADAGCEAHHFKGFWDSELYDACECADQIDVFTQIYYALFVKGDVASIDYTAYMLKRLMGPFMIPPWIVPGGKTIGFSGDIDVTLVQLCLSRMACFVKLAVSVLQSEFPSWEILQSFSIFKLDGGKGRLTNVFKKKMRRLAHFVECDEGDLMEEFTKLRPIAANIKKQKPEMTSLRAWQSTLQKVSLGQRRKNYPCANVRKVLIRYCAYSGCTTQKQEGTHSIQSHLLNPRRSHMLPVNEKSEIKIVIDIADDNKLLVIAGAKKVWSVLYGAPRRSQLNRIDTGTEKPWLKKYKVPVE